MRFQPRSSPAHCFFQLPVLVTLWLPSGRWWGHSQPHLWLVGFDPKHCYKTSTAILSTTYKTYCFIRSLTSILVFNLHRSSRIRPCRTANWILITHDVWSPLNEHNSIKRPPYPNHWPFPRFKALYLEKTGEIPQVRVLVRESIHFYGNYTTKGKSLNALVCIMIIVSLF